MKRVLIGMSGGVDSSVAALVLKNEGYDVVGTTMILNDDDSITSGCLSSKSVTDAKSICDKLGIEHIVIDLRSEFKKYVIDNFVDTYKNGGTPNPCVVCNKYLKFGLLWKKAQELGCNYIATGHYARSYDGKILKSKSIEKDQSYFLYGIDKVVVKHIIFPLERFENKDKVREFARDNGFSVSEKKDSQDICFISDGDYATLIETKLGNKSLEGNFVLKDGTIIGRHKGIIHYTIGQRRGLGISYSEPLYVISINPSNNTVVLGREKDLYSNYLICHNINLLVSELPEYVFVKIRSRSNEVRAKLELLDEDTIKVIFDEAQKSVTKGQSVVFYDDDVLVGGGIIE